MTDIKSMTNHCVRVSDFSIEELITIENRLEELGVKIHEKVEPFMVCKYEDGYYGIYADVGAIFFLYSESYNSCGVPSVVDSREDFLQLIGLDTSLGKTGETESMDLRGKCVRVSDFTIEELKSIQSKFDEVGVYIAEEVTEDMVDFYKEGFYGVDSDNDSMFYDSAMSYGGFSIDHCHISREELSNYLGLGFTVSDSVEIPKLYKLSVRNGFTYYFSDEAHVREILKSEDPELARETLATIVLGRVGEVIKNRLTIKHLIETSINIEEI